MTSMTLDKQQSVYILTLTNGQQENALNRDVLNEYNDIFDQIENSTHNASLVIQSDHPKTFCNGLDLIWLLQQSPEDKKAFITQLENTLIRLALLNLPVLAAINGNAYAGGTILAAACDFRLMREDKGRFCLPEVNINIPFTPALMDIVQLLPNPYAVQQMALTGQALTSKACLQSQIVNHLYPEDALQMETLKLAEEMAQKNRTTYTVIKHQLRSKIVQIAKERGIYDEKKYASPLGI